MELELIRTYYPNGTNGILSTLQDQQRAFICFTIELPWLNNKPSKSCIPEGKYEMTKRYSQHFGWHLLINDVEQRNYILMHAFNDAVKESKGCIAPVSILTGPGRGNNSRLALKKLLAVIYLALEKGNNVFITITSSRPSPKGEGE